MERESFMLEREAFGEFAKDPLKVLDDSVSRREGVVEVGARRFVVSDPMEARAVLHDGEGRFRDHSDFFHTRHGVFGPRETQMAIRRGAREIFRTFLSSSGEAGVQRFVAENLPDASEWPDTGNYLTYRYLLPALVGPDAPPRLLRLLEQVVERAVLANARQRQSRLRRMVLQFRTSLELARAIESRQKAGRSAPSDILDVIASAAQAQHKPDELAEVFLSFLFAVAGSVGFALAWSVYLLGTNPRRDVPTEWVVQEALRLWPVAWLLNRHPEKPHQIAGAGVQIGDDVAVCPYSIHRHPDYWAEPSEFRPERWSEAEQWRNPAFLPFGYGPHRCVVGDIASRLVSDILRTIVDGRRPQVIAASTQPSVAAAMAPPPFTLVLGSREERGERRVAGMNEASL